MSLKRRNILAYFLLLLAACCFIGGKRELSPEEASPPISTTTITSHALPTENSHIPFETTTVETTLTETTSQTPQPTQASEIGNPILGYFLYILGMAAFLIGVFALWQKAPLLGIDTVCFLFSVILFFRASIPTPPLGFQILRIGIFLICIRETFGWLLGKCRLSWCLTYRVIKHLKKTQISLLLLTVWIMGVTAGMCFMIGGLLKNSIPSLILASIALLFVFAVLWKYGSEIENFKKQLLRFGKGLEVFIQDEAFSEAEEQLAQIQKEHEEAIQSAVTSERFKVELISNVSHDLRTPLTAILGYSELLQKESLSEEGKKQLMKLYQKADYMNELVDSLFELTKVSSGALECKKESIDLICLLEQTIGLFDDELTKAGLTVRRNYSSDPLNIITDGSRMHQVFANLLGNAIKYALNGTRIHLEVKETDQAVTVRMVNTSSYEMDFDSDEILERFARGDKTRSTKGSGLGLAIAKTYTESVGGNFYIRIDGDQFNAIAELFKN